MYGLKNLIENTRKFEHMHRLYASNCIFDTNSNFLEIFATGWCKYFLFQT